MISKQPLSTTTLTVQGIVWECSKFNGRVAFRCAPHSIIFDPWSGFYQIREKGETVFVARSVAECLENAAEIIFDFYADSIVPSWEFDSLEVWMMEHHAQHFKPAWAECSHS